MSQSEQLHILYAEDDPGVARLFQLRLERLGHEVDIASDGQHALDMWRSTAYDMLFVDYHMPRKTGLDVIRSLASDDLSAPIIMIAGAGDEAVAVEALKLGAFDYVVKDLNNNYLEMMPSVIEEALSRKRLITYKRRAEQALQEEHDQLKKRVEEQANELAVALDRLRNEMAERSRAEAEIRRQKGFLEKVLESLTHPMYVVDAASYAIKMANSACGQQGDLGHTTCYELTHRRSEPCSGIDHPCPLETVRETRRPVTVEHTHYDDAGRRRAIEIHAYPMEDDDGEVTQAIMYSLDITDRKQAEEPMRELVETSSTIVQNIPSGLLVLQYQAPAELFLVNANLEACRLLDISVQEWRGQELDEIWPSARSQGLTAALLKSAETGTQFETKAAIYKRDKLERRLSLRSFAMSGQLLGVFFVEAGDSAQGESTLQNGSHESATHLSEALKQVHQLTAQHARAEEELEEAQEKLCSLLALMPIGVVVCDPNGHMTELNGLAVEHLRLPSSESAVGSKMTDFTFLVESGIAEAVEESFALGQTVEGEFSVPGGSGGSVPTKLSVHPLRGSGGAMRGTVTFLNGRTHLSPNHPSVIRDALLIVDSASVTRILQKGLGKLVRTVSVASSESEALSAVVDREVSLIVCDMTMSGSSGWDVARKTKALCESKGLVKPRFVLVTSPGGALREREDKKAECGVDVVLEKPVNLGTLLEVVKAFEREGSPAGSEHSVGAN